MMLLPPFPLTKYRKCERCGLKTPKKQINCQHCANITDEKELEQFIEHWGNIHQGNKSFGYLFLIMGLICICIIVAAAL